MALLYQKHIKRSDLQANPSVMYVFGDNVQRWGKKGQSFEMRGEPNAHGIATKWAPSMEPGSFFENHQFDEVEKILMADLLPVFERLQDSRIVVWPLMGIGTGLASTGDQDYSLSSQMIRRALKEFEQM